MGERATWHIVGHPETPLVGADLAAAVMDRISTGRFDTTALSETGAILHVVSNGERAMVVLLAFAGDPGGHAVDPTATGSSAGFILDNGQNDEYPDTDTVDVGTAMRIIEAIADGRAVPPRQWHDDRA